MKRRAFLKGILLAAASTLIDIPDLTFSNQPKHFPFIEDINKAIKTVHEATGYKPDVILLGENAYNILMEKERNEKRLHNM